MLMMRRPMDEKTKDPNQNLPAFRFATLAILSPLLLLPDAIGGDTKFVAVSKSWSSLSRHLSGRTEQRSNSKGGNKSV